MLRLTLLACLSSLAVPVSAQQETTHDQPVPSQSADAATRRDVLLRLVSDAQAYFQKPAAFGGGDQSFDGISLKALEYSVDVHGQHVRTPSGSVARHTYTLTETDGGVVIKATSDRDNEVLRAVVHGPTLDDIAVNF